MQSQTSAAPVDMRLVGVTLLACLGAVAATYDDNQVVDFDDSNPENTPIEEPKNIVYEEAECQSVTDGWERVMKESSCSKLVEVYINTTEDDRYKYSPTRVKAMRCGGMCPQFQACMSTGKTTVKIPVMRIPLEGGEPECAHALVENDNSCMCNCIIKPENCGEKQTHNMKKCRCECEDMTRNYNECIAKGKAWHGKECKCVCRKESRKKCQFYEMWDDDRCKCVKHRNSRRWMWER